MGAPSSPSTRWIRSSTAMPKAYCPISALRVLADGALVRSAVTSSNGPVKPVAPLRCDVACNSDGEKNQSEGCRASGALAVGPGNPGPVADCQCAAFGVAYRTGTSAYAVIPVGP